MHTSDLSAGQQAATTSPKAELPRFSVPCDWIDRHAFEVEARAARTTEGGSDIPALVWVDMDAGPLRFHVSMTPQQARWMAVCLVDCANALDNPTARVIVDEAEQNATHAAGRCSCGEGIGHE